MVGMSLSEVAFLRRVAGPGWRVSGIGGLAGPGLRFGLAGGVVAVVYIASTSLLAEVLGVDFQVALATGFALAIITHFALQRKFVWTHPEGFAVSLRHQVLRYMVVAGTQYGLTAAATSVLPGVLHVAREIVYLCCAAGLTATNFVIFRAAVFHPAGPPEEN
jgi:putative flippase GtrA